MLLGPDVYQNWHNEKARGMKIIIAPDAKALARTAAELFTALARTSIEERGQFVVALSGGSTPRQLYIRLADPEFSTQIPWRAVHLFWGDERCVPPDHPESNYRMVKESLRVSIPSANIHRIAGELSPYEAAALYEQELRTFFGNTPLFDLVLLGLGEDGHTASLFPASPALHEQFRWVVAVSHNVPPPPLVPRVTLTLPVINRAREVLFLVSGVAKAERVAQILGHTSSSTELPAGAVNPSDGNLTWLLDAPAAALLKNNS